MKSYEAESVLNRRTVSIAATCSIFLLTVIQLPGLVDRWNELGIIRDETERLKSNYGDNALMTKLATQFETVQMRLAEVSGQMVDQEDLSGIQSKMVELAERTGCKLKKAVIAPSSTESWISEAQAQAGDNDFERSDADCLALTTHSLNVRFEGSLQQTYAFLQEVWAGGDLMQLSQVSMTRDAEVADSLKIDASLAYFKLEKDENEDYQ